MQWFKKHPEFLRKESTALSNDSNYKELFQVRDNLFLSHGSILVRLDSLYRFPILIVYTDATPYNMPLIFPLKRILEKLEFEKLSSLSLEKLQQKIKPDVNFYYHLRHQNSSGILCAIEWENLDDGSKFFGITTILQRVRDWCVGHILGIYPPDSQETDFCSHFNFINKELKFFYSDNFLNNSFIEGDCYATLYNIIPEGRYYSYPRYLYFGAFIDGIGKSGLIEQIQEIPLAKIHEKLKTSLDVYKYPEIINDLVRSKKILKASWFHVEIEPTPFKSFDELIKIIGNNDVENGIKRLKNQSYQLLKTIPDDFLLGIRFPNRKGIYEFQFFKIYKKNPAPVPIIDNDPDKRMPSIIASYDMVEAIEGERITKENFHLRNSTRADYQILKDVTVNIMGVGALGSEIADCLAKAGIGKLTLLDSQIFKAHNPVRHLSGMEHIGELKVHAVAEILHNHNPFIQIIPIPFNLYNLDPCDLPDNSISITSVADDNVEGFLNEQFVIANKTAFYVRGLRGGKVGRIFRVIPGQDACFHCLNLYRQDKKDFIEIPVDQNYPTLKNECNNPIRPGSAADLKIIASIASRILIDNLQNFHSSINHWIWSSEEIEESPLRSYQIHQQHLPPHPKCFYCNHGPKLEISISKTIIKYMQSLIKENPKIETGGVLAGYCENNHLKITDASDPGPKAIKTATKFEKDVEYCQNFLDKLYISSHQKTVYLGEWHSHPCSDNSPSGTDIRSLSDISIQKEYLTTSPVMIIFSDKGEPSFTIHPAGRRFYSCQVNIF